MSKKTVTAPTEMLTLLSHYLKATQDVVGHIGATRGPHAPYCHICPYPWPLKALEVLHRDTPRVIEYLKSRHFLDVCGPLERICQAVITWTAKRDTIAAFGKTKHADSDAAAVAAHALSQFTEEGLPEQRRLNLDLRIAEGAFWRAQFPLLAERFGKERTFLIRSNLIRWVLWVQKAFAGAIREWPLPDERAVSARQDDDAWGGLLESQERWELVGVVIPRYVPNTDETPKKLAIEEARRAGDLTVVLPLITQLASELEAFVREAAGWPQGNLQPSCTEHLLRAVSELEDLVGSESGPCGGALGVGDRDGKGLGDGSKTSNEHKKRVPAWGRLEIIKSHTGDDLARLDSKDYRLTGGNDARFLELLQEKRGAPILASTLESQFGERPARIYGRLPKAIQGIIDKPGQRTGKKGYRML